MRAGPRQFALLLIVMVATATSAQTHSTQTKPAHTEPTDTTEAREGSYALTSSLLDGAVVLEWADAQMVWPRLNQQQRQQVLAAARTSIQSGKMTPVTAAPIEWK